MMKITIRVDKASGRIADIKFQTLGCGAAIATSSLVTEMAKGKTLDEAMKISRTTIAEGLDGLPPNKLHCSNLAADGLHKAIEDFRNRQKAAEKN
jgi:nitrogen fixation NifU-like protein